MQKKLEYKDPNVTEEQFTIYTLLDGKFYSPAMHPIYVGSAYQVKSQAEAYSFLDYEIAIVPGNRMVRWS